MLEKRVFIFNALLFPFLTIFTFAALLVESITYSGSISKFLLLDAKSFMLLDILSGILLVVGRKIFNKIKSNASLAITKLLFQLNYLLLPAFALVYYLMISAEAKNYPNYVFSTFRVDPDNFIYLVVLSGFIIFCSFAMNNLNSSIDNFKKLFGFRLIDNRIFNKDLSWGKNSFYKLLNFKLKKNKVYKDENLSPGIREKLTIILIVLILFFAVDNSIQTIRDTFKFNVYIFTHINITYDQKMTYSWHFYYEYMVFVKKNTAQNSIIVIPPATRPWLYEGNDVLDRFFLYPRTIVYQDSVGQNGIVPDYYLLAKGLWPLSLGDSYGWPKDFINASKIIYFVSPNIPEKVISGNFNPKNSINQNSWGLVVVSKK